MLVKNCVSPKMIAHDYDTEPQNIEATQFEDQYIVLTVSVDRLLWLAKSWKCPKLEKNRSVLPEPAWKTAHNQLLQYGKNLKIKVTAQLCGTFYKYGTSYLIWLEFTGPDNIWHKLDVFIKEKSSKGEVYAYKVVDGVKCDLIYNSIIQDSHIPSHLAKKLHSIGSSTWTGSAETKVQYKLNSNNGQEHLFEDVADKCPFVRLTPLDRFNDYLYRGDPGCLADYDLTIINDDGKEVTARIDLKLLFELTDAKLEEQNPHDAELLIATDLGNSGSIRCLRVQPASGIEIETLPKFSEFMQLFKKSLIETPPKYLHIKQIDAETGSVVYDFFS